MNLKHTHNREKLIETNLKQIEQTERDAKYTTETLSKDPKNLN